MSRQNYSRRNNSDDGLAVLGCLAMLALPFIMLYEVLKTPITSKILKLDAERPQTWGIPIKRITCPNCGSFNEADRHYCFACNTEIRATAITSKNKNEKDIPIELIVYCVIFGGFIIFMAIALSY